MVAPSRRPPALKHGLASRFAREAACDQADELAAALIGSSPATPEIMDAARAAAEELLHLHRVRRLRHVTFASGTLVQVPDFGTRQTQLLEITRAILLDDAASCERARAELARTFACNDDELARMGQQAIIRSMSEKAPDLKTLDDYERKASSRLRKALRRLDYERVEDHVPCRGVADGLGHRAFPAWAEMISWPRLAG